MSGGRDTADHFDHAAGDEIHRDRQRRTGHAKVEVARDREVAGECRVLQVAHARRSHAGLGEPVVQPGGRAVAEVGADGLMDRAEHLKKHEDHARNRQRTGQGTAALHGADQHTHGDRERRRQNPAEQKGRPPGSGQT